MSGGLLVKVGRAWTRSCSHCREKALEGTQPSRTMEQQFYGLPRICHSVKSRSMMEEGTLFRDVSFLKEDLCAVCISCTFQVVLWELYWHNAAGSTALNGVAREIEPHGFVSACRTYKCKSVCQHVELLELYGRCVEIPVQQLHIVCVSSNIKISFPMKVISNDCVDSLALNHVIEIHISVELFVKFAKWLQIWRLF
eukprot:5150150-Amphidinium_carterae.1